ncbi:MAG TPA: hypothetical protein VM324_13240 [Egibacteraceae bacterium]|jgi:hypothetical protein|nr:hypothetical protein [Egibacteraceae bacterium]
MWAFASKRLRRWVIVAVGVPVAAWTLDRLGERLEERGGETYLTKVIGNAGDWLHGQQRGPAVGRRGRPPVR